MGTCGECCFMRFIIIMLQGVVVVLNVAAYGCCVCMQKEMQPVKNMQGMSGVNKKLANNSWLSRAEIDPLCSGGQISYRVVRDFGFISRFSIFHFPIFYSTSSHPTFFFLHTNNALTNHLRTASHPPWRPPPSAGHDRIRYRFWDDHFRHSWYSQTR